MKKIMFNDKYGLTAAVLNGTKTMTRRIVPKKYVPMIEDGLQGAALIEAQHHGDAFRENEIVAVTQCYRDIINQLPDRQKEYVIGYYSGSKAWTNKMFVRPDLMPHRIRITDIKVERLQDISDDDCMNEGVIETTDGFTGEKVYTFLGSEINYMFAITAFAALIDKVSGKGTWESNPWVFAYTFELID